MQVHAFRSTLWLCALAGFICALGGCERAAAPPTHSATAPSAGAGASAGQQAPSALSTAVTTPNDAIPASQSAPAPAPTSTAAAPADPPKFVAYYFHRTVRCPTCLSIEKQAQAAIEEAYAPELSAGLLEWRPVNIEESGNAHFEADFALEAQSLVLVETAGGHVTRWKNLKRVWELVEDPLSFPVYVVDEIGVFLGGG
jgi:hypothetical protein